MTATSEPATSQDAADKSGRAIAVVLLLALIVRIAIVVKDYDNLEVDRDAYWSIARSLVSNWEFRDPAVRWPSAAYRPPLYPVLLAGLHWLKIDALGLAIIQIIAGTGTVWLTYLCGRYLGLRRLANFAALCVALDPLLVYYTTMPMTETVFAGLTTGLLLLLVSSQSRSQRWQIATGFVFGLCALCRPTIWAFAVLGGVVWLVLSVVRLSRSHGEGQANDATGRQLPWLLPLAAVITISPWVVRNTIVLGNPVVMTTHGGYTLLLGNNPMFYEEVVAQPWGTVWSEGSVMNWQRLLEEQMRKADPPVTTELERDRWMHAQAVEVIRNQPAFFLQACMLRFLRFWNISPLGDIGRRLPGWLAWGVTGGYALLFLIAILGLLNMEYTDWLRWRPVLLLIVAFTLVHLVYWSNARMRAPVMPAVALLAAHGFNSRRHDLEDQSSE